MEASNKRRGEGNRKGNIKDKFLPIIRNIDKLFNSIIFSKEKVEETVKKQQRIDGSIEYSWDQSELYAAIESHTTNNLREYYREHKLPLYGKKGTLCAMIVGDLNVDDALNIIR